MLAIILNLLVLRCFHAVAAIRFGAGRPCPEDLRVVKVFFLLPDTVTDAGAAPQCPL